MAALSKQHSKRLEEMIEQHKEELRKLEGIKDEELKVLLRYERRTGGWVALSTIAYKEGSTQKGYLLDASGCNREGISQV